MKWLADKLSNCIVWLLDSIIAFADWVGSDSVTCFLLFLALFGTIFSFLMYSFFLTW